jgi:hypothetical protein
MRAYRKAPRLAAALVPALPLSRSLLARVHGLLSGFGSKAGAAKQLALCAGVAGSAAVGMAVGVVPGPLGSSGERALAPTIERAVTGPSPVPSFAGGARAQRHQKARAKPGQRERRRRRLESGSAEAPAAEAVEYEAPVEAPPVEVSTAPPPEPAPSTSSGSAAGEFGP